MTPQQLTGQTDEHLTCLMMGQKSFLVHPDVQNDLMGLSQAAVAAGFDFHIASGFRPFDRQCWIWNRKMSGEASIKDADNRPIDVSKLSEHEKVMAILRWSALPGASRHHWGTDFDVYAHNALPDATSLQLEPWEYLSGHQSGFYQWLSEHLESFGFYFPYQQGGSGVAFEPWHISHRATARRYLAQLTVPVLANQLKQSNILGQKSILASLPSIYNEYVINVSD
ncbi:M15 family metallopeptidase [Vibrio zhugei]|uniref:M15 family metallopeptidase n=1 Tax=Vibrio zhugei TaxID=2479546 RepID=A0ABV7CC77_9VIBR|nr:M15 family metallopeptidase [Vibrio zhugei]